MAYATVQDVQARMNRILSQAEQTQCGTLLDDAAIMIDATGSTAIDDIKMLVSCRMVIRALGDGESDGIPIGATQGSQSGLGYSQSWTVSSGGSAGELYIESKEYQMLGVRNKIGSYSPVQELAPHTEG
jgi:hypothetical protein